MSDNKKLAELLYPNNKYTVEQILKMYPSRKLEKSQEVTRFAPSPTGFLHLGHFFQCVINKFLAKQNKGVFYYRVEDTDKKREVAGADKFAYDKISEYGFVPDEGWSPNGELGEYGPYRQSERLEIYKAFGKRLVEEGRAYPCFCDATEGKEDVLENREKQLEQTATLLDHDKCRELSIEKIKDYIDEGKAFALRLKSLNNQDDKVVIHDRVRGDREIPANLRDAVLIKKDGIPPYHFAHPIDDYLMGTTVVVRGEEWYPSAPLHAEICEALNIPVISYLHTAVLCKIDEKTGNKRKFSKRLDPEFNIEYFDKMGYPKEAVLEYVLTLANSNFEDWRKANSTLNIFEFPFSVERMGTSSPMFDLVKLTDISKNIIAYKKAEVLFLEAKDWAQKYDKDFALVLQKNKTLAINALNIDREVERPRKDIGTYQDIKSLYAYFFNELLNKESLLNFDAKFKAQTLKMFIKKYAESLNLNVSKDEWFANVKEVANACGFAVDNKAYKANPQSFAGNVADACSILRVALCGKNKTPDLYSIMQTLGEEEVLSRLNFVYDKL